MLADNSGGLNWAVNGDSPIDGQKSILKPELLPIYFQRKSVVKPERLPINNGGLIGRSPLFCKKSIVKPECLPIIFGG